MPKADSIINAEERSAAIKAEAARLAKEQAVEEDKRKVVAAEREAKMVDAEVAVVEKHIAIIDQIDTRDALLDHIRAMRNDPSEAALPPTPASHRTETQQTEYDAEVEMGRKMVARAEAIEAKAREFRARIAAEEAARSGHMTPVYIPNPGQGEAFPANKATFGQPNVAQRK